MAMHQTKHYIRLFSSKATCISIHVLVQSCTVDRSGLHDKNKECSYGGPPSQKAPHRRSHSGSGYPAISKLNYNQVLAPLSFSESGPEWSSLCEIL